MITRIVRSAIPQLADAHPVTVTVTKRRNQKPLTGLEAERTGRLIAAIRAIQTDFSANGFTVSFNTPHTHYDHLDLAIAIGILAIHLRIRQQKLENALIAGPLDEAGYVGGLPGGLAIGDLSSWAAQADLTQLLLPAGTASEALLAPGAVTPIPIYRLRQAIDHIRGITLRAQAPPNYPDSYAQAPTPCLSEIPGAEFAKWGLEVAAAGGHPALLFGPNGSNREHLAECLPHILPPLSTEEVLTVGKIQALETNDSITELPTTPPFRNLWYNPDLADITGYYTDDGYYRPGAVSLANHGVLYVGNLWHLPETAVQAIEIAIERGPLCIPGKPGEYVVRIPGTKFHLIASLGHCSCANAGTQNPCDCDYTLLSQHDAFLRTNPFLRHFQIRIPTEVPNAVTGTYRRHGETNADVQSRVIAARERQMKRGGLNATVDGNALKPLLSPAAEEALRIVYHHQLTDGNIIFRVACTLADLEGVTQVVGSHVYRAANFRPRPVYPSHPDHIGDPS